MIYVFHSLQALRLCS